jgi:hypothetical protein
LGSSAVVQCPFGLVDHTLEARPDEDGNGSGVVAALYEDHLVVSHLPLLNDLAGA